MLSLDLLRSLVVVAFVLPAKNIELLVATRLVGHLHRCEGVGTFLVALGLAPVVLLLLLWGLATVALRRLL